MNSVLRLAARRMKLGGAAAGAGSRAGERKRLFTHNCCVKLSQFSSNLSASSVLASLLC